MEQQRQIKESMSKCKTPRGILRRMNMKRTGGERRTGLLRRWETRASNASPDSTVVLMMADLYSFSAGDLEELEVTVGF